MRFLFLGRNSRSIDKRSVATIRAKRKPRQGRVCQRLDGLHGKQHIRDRKTHGHGQQEPIGWSDQHERAQFSIARHIYHHNRMQSSKYAFII